MAFLGNTREYLLHLGADEGTFRKAKTLRQSMTEAEIKLWQELKRRKLNGLKFRRQHPIHRYIADFYCHEIRLVIEIDGEIHLTKDRKEHDDNRTEELDRLGITVIRFTNDQILNSLPDALKEIERITTKFKTNNPPSP